MRNDVTDVSVGKDQLCAISNRSAIVCWSYLSEGYKLQYVPRPLYLADNAKSVQTGSNKHCSIDNKNSLICWGLDQFDFNRPTKDRRYKELIEADKKILMVSVGNE